MQAQAGHEDMGKVQAVFAQPPFGPAVMQAAASMETQGIVEPPPEWNRPDEGNPNMPRRPPEYQPPQVSHFLPECWPCGLRCMHRREFALSCFMISDRPASAAGCIEEDSR